MKIGNNKEGVRPPRWAIAFLNWFCPGFLFETIEGDLVEQFEIDLKEVGKNVARRRFVWNVIRFIRPSIILRNIFSTDLIRGYMLKAYFKSAWRQMAKNRILSLIHVFGLAVGIASSFTILQYVSFELSFDKFHTESDDIYRIILKQYENNELKNTTAMNYVGIRSLLKDNFPEIKKFTGFNFLRANTGFVFRYGNKMYQELGGNIWADSSFFKVFPSMLETGNASTVLAHDRNLVISQRIARKIFGDTDPIGQELQDLGDLTPGSSFIVTGVMKNFPENSHFHADFITKIDRPTDTLSEYWTTPQMLTYVQIPRSTNVGSVESRLNALIKNLEKMYPTTRGTQIALQPMTDIHFTTGIADEREAGTSKIFIYLMTAIGLTILIIAWINYVNLETAQYLTRAREIGIRRIVGSSKHGLAVQFLVKFFFVNLLALVVAVILFWLSLPQLAFVTGITIDNIQSIATKIGYLAGGIFLAGSLITGTYPLLFLLKLSPVLSLKGNLGGLTGVKKGNHLLIIFQFTSSIVLIAFVLVASQQLNFMRTTNKKIDLEKVIAIRNPTAYADQPDTEKHNEFKVLENKLLESPDIKLVSSSSAIPGAEMAFTIVNNLKRNAKDPYDPTREKIFFVDYNFIPLYGLKMKAGRNYSEGNGVEENTGRIILNESAIHALGFHSADEALNQTVSLAIWDWVKPDFKIIGVVEDYRHETIKKPIFPTIFWLNQNRFQQVYYSIKLNAGANPQNALSYIKKSWKEVFPDRPFDFFFIDDYYDQQFKSEVQFSRIFAVFAGIAVFLACLGILGISLFEANSKLKEISIRKVLGASIANLVSLLIKRHFKTILIAGALSVPIIYVCASNWLNSYPVRIQITLWFFLLPLVLMIALVGLTSGFQITKAASTNPVDYLKND